MKRHALLIAALVAAFATLGSNSTKLLFTWMNPNYSGARFRNILVLAINGRPSIRAEFEDQLSAAIARPGIQAIPSYSLLPRPNATPIDMNQLRDVVQGQHIDAIFASRVIKYTKTVTDIPGQVYTPDPYYETFYGYYEAGLPGRLYPGLPASGQNRPDRNELLFHGEARRRIHLDRHQRHRQPSNANEGRGCAGEDPDPGIAIAKDYSVGVLGMTRL